LDGAGVQHRLKSLPRPSGAAARKIPAVRGVMSGGSPASLPSVQAGFKSYLLCPCFLFVRALGKTHSLTSFGWVLLAGAAWQSRRVGTSCVWLLSVGIIRSVFYIFFSSSILSLNLRMLCLPVFFQISPGFDPSAQSVCQ
jgi:hypothetical protein